MKAVPCALDGVFLLEPELVLDDRGFFARSFGPSELASYGLCADVPECNISYNRKRGTLRGLHYQVAPHGETKVVTCVRGAIYDVLLDLRPASPSFERWMHQRLDERGHRSLYVPEGVAHGFQTLTDETVVLYHMTASYSPMHARGVRWDDPAFGILWPEPSPILSARDRAHGLYARGGFERTDVPTRHDEGPCRAS